MEPTNVSPTTSQEPEMEYAVDPGWIDSDEQPIEKYEDLTCQMKEWLSSIYSPTQVDRALKSEKIEKGTDKERLRLTAKIWTFLNEYRIIALTYLYDDRNYLGCQVSTRKSRTGETWTRGNDLPDGKFNEKTWNRIMTAIVRYEAEEVKSEKWKEG